MSASSSTAAAVAARGDPRLDFCAETFDSAVALAASSHDIVLPYPKIKAQDNLSKLGRILFPANYKHKQAAKNNLGTAAAKKKAKGEEFVVRAEAHPFHPDRVAERERAAQEAAAAAAVATADGVTAVAAAATGHSSASRVGEDDTFLIAPHTATTAATMTTAVPKGTTKKRRRKKNVLEGMRGCEGPLVVLESCMRERRRVRVRVRRREGSCTCDGYLAAFDRHMNLVLTDVTESYHALTLRPRREVNPMPTNALSRSQRRKGSRLLRVVAPTQRHLSQLLVRGDSVLVVGEAPQSPLI